MKGIEAPLSSMKPIKKRMDEDNESSLVENQVAEPEAHGTRGYGRRKLHGI